MLHCVVYNVRLGQCVAFIPKDDRNYTMFIDCGHDDNFHPVDHIIEYLGVDEKGNEFLGNLTLTNYDHDHFSGLPYLKSKIKIKTVNFSENLTSDELEDIKDEITPALQAVIDIKTTYTSSAKDHSPPYTKKIFRLTVEDLEENKVAVTTNNLSQLVFITYGGKTICITGDLEKPSWNIMLKKKDVRNFLQKTDVFFASHHGRINGYCADVFKYCKPECIIISDKEIVHGTQEDMSQLYAKHIYGDGIIFKSGENENKRKVITTRSDGHILINVPSNGDIEYISYFL